MYALAIWDSGAQKLVMIRDRMGIKPFYCYPAPDGVLFGSEPKAILANPAVPRVVTGDGLHELFTLTKTPGHAVWAGMREVLPARSSRWTGAACASACTGSWRPGRTLTASRRPWPTSGTCWTTSSAASW